VEISIPLELIIDDPASDKNSHSNKTSPDKLLAARIGSTAFARQWFENWSNKSTPMRTVCPTDFFQIGMIVT
jgi:hypothetical protein